MATPRCISPQNKRGSKRNRSGRYQGVVVAAEGEEIKRRLREVERDNTVLRREIRRIAALLPWWSA